MKPISEHKKFVLAFKFMFFINIIFAVLIVALSIAIISLFPLKEKEPYLVHFSKAEDTYVLVQKANQRLRTNTALINSELESYLINRETINRATHNIRRKKVLLYSSNDEAKRYLNITNASKAIIIQEDFYRTPKVLSISNVSSNVAIIEFEVIDDIGGTKNKPQYYKATIRFTFTNLKLKAKDKYFNPLGLIVDEYQISTIRNN